MRFRKGAKRDTEVGSKPEDEPTSGDMFDTLTDEERKKVEGYMERINVWRERGFQVSELEDMVMEGRFEDFEKTYPAILRTQRESITGGKPVKKVSLDETAPKPEAAPVLHNEEEIVTIPGVYVRKKGDKDAFTVEDRPRREHQAPAEDVGDIFDMVEESIESKGADDDDKSIISEFVDMVGDAGSRIIKPAPAIDDSGTGVYDDISSSLADEALGSDTSSLDVLEEEIKNLRSPREIAAELKAAREKEMTGPLGAIARDARLCPTCSAVASHRNRIEVCTECGKVGCGTCNDYDEKHKKTHLYYDFVFDLPLCASCYEKNFVIQQQLAKAMHSMGNGNLTYAREYVKSALQVDPSSIYAELARKLLYKIDHIKERSRKENLTWRQTLSKDKDKKKYPSRSVRKEKTTVDDIIWRRKPQA